MTTLKVWFATWRVSVWNARAGLADSQLAVWGERLKKALAGHVTR